MTDPAAPPLDHPACFTRLVAALNAPSPEAIAAAFGEAASIDRHGGGTAEEPGRLLETFTGHEQIGKWLALMPPGRFSFALRGPAPLQPGDDPALPRIAYAIYGPDGFENTGTWVARLGGDGRIAWLGHRPFALIE